MMFNALSKELYSLQQRSGENVAEQVQILQSEYLGRKQKHVEEMKQDTSTRA